VTTYDIRAATEADLSQVKAIYDLEVLHGIATFDLEPPPLAYWRARLEDTAVGTDPLVGVRTRVGQVAGYAYASAYRPRPAYGFTRETSVYLEESARGQGLGRGLYDELLGRLTDAGLHTAVALVALPNPASVALHRATGFTEVGVLREVGRKQDRWVDTAWFQRLLRPARA
jgi:L-amino acid N-acyltransferase YncA